MNTFFFWKINNSKISKMNLTVWSGSVVKTFQLFYIQNGAKVKELKILIGKYIGEEM